MKGTERNLQKKTRLAGGFRQFQVRRCSIVLVSGFFLPLGVYAQTPDSTRTFWLLYHEKAHRVWIASPEEVHAEIQKAWERGFLLSYLDSGRRVAVLRGPRMEMCVQLFGMDSVRMYTEICGTPRNITSTIQREVRGMFTQGCDSVRIHIQEIQQDDSRKRLLVKMYMECPHRWIWAENPIRILRRMNTSRVWYSLMGMELEVFPGRPVNFLRALDTSRLRKRLLQAGYRIHGMPYLEQVGVDSLNRKVCLVLPGIFAEEFVQAEGSLQFTRAGSGPIQISGNARIFLDQVEGRPFRLEMTWDGSPQNQQLQVSGWIPAILVWERDTLVVPPALAKLATGGAVSFFRRDTVAFQLEWSLLSGIAGGTRYFWGLGPFQRQEIQPDTSFRIRGVEVQGFFRTVDDLFLPVNGVYLGARIRWTSGGTWESGGYGLILVRLHRVISGGVATSWGNTPVGELIPLGRAVRQIQETRQIPGENAFRMENPGWLALLGWVRLTPTLHLIPAGGLTWDLPISSGKQQLLGWGGVFLRQRSTRSGLTVGIFSGWIRPGQVLPVWLLIQYGFVSGTNFSGEKR